MAPTKAKKYSSDPRQRMKELQAEGKMTPEHGKLGGRPRKGASESQRKKRASTVIAEYARDHSDKIAEVISDILRDPDASESMKLRAIKLALGVEGVETDRERDELADPSSARSQELAASPDQAKAQIASMLADPVTGQRLRSVLAGLVTQTGDPAQSA